MMQVIGAIAGEYRQAYAKNLLQEYVDYRNCDKLTGEAKIKTAGQMYEILRIALVGGYKKGILLQKQYFVNHPEFPMTIIASHLPISTIIKSFPDILYYEKGSFHSSEVSFKEHVEDSFILTYLKGRWISYSPEEEDNAIPLIEAWDKIHPNLSLNAAIIYAGSMRVLDHPIALKPSSDGIPLGALYAIRWRHLPPSFMDTDGYAKYCLRDSAPVYAECTFCGHITENMYRENRTIVCEDCAKVKTHRAYISKECAICRDLLQNEEKCVVFICGHVFHKDCITERKCPYRCDLSHGSVEFIDLEEGLDREMLQKIFELKGE